MGTDERMLRATDAQPPKSCAQPGAQPERNPCATRAQPWRAQPPIPPATLALGQSRSRFARKEQPSRGNPPPGLAGRDWRHSWPTAARNGTSPLTYPRGVYREYPVTTSCSVSCAQPSRGFSPPSPPAAPRLAPRGVAERGSGPAMPWPIPRPCGASLGAVSASRQRRARNGRMVVLFYPSGGCVIRRAPPNTGRSGRVAPAPA